MEKEGERKVSLKERLYRCTDVRMYRLSNLYWLTCALKY